MAIDDDEKRRAAAGVPTGLALTPDALKGATWRRQVAGSYADFGDDEENPYMATTPYVSGSSSLARRLLAGQMPRILWLGDSVSFAFAQAPYLALSRLGPARGYGMGQRWTSGGTNGTCFTGDTTVNDFVSPLDFGGWWAQVDFGGGTSDASDTSSANRMLYHGNIGPSGGMADNARSFVTGQTAYLGSNLWGNTLAAGRSLTLRYPIRRHSGGPQNTDCYLRLIDGSTEIARSSYFSGYAASTMNDYVSITIPSNAAQTYSWLQMEVRFRANTASESGKKLYISGRGTLVDDTITSACHEWHDFAQGGMTIDNLADPSFVSDDDLSVIQIINPDYVAMMYGLNDSSGNDAANFKTDLLAGISRIRGFLPNVPIDIVAPYTRGSYGADYGGEGLEPYYTAGAYQAHRATPNSTFTNLTRMLPSAGILYGGQGHMTYSSITNGHYIDKGECVEDASNLYCCKAGHFKSGTAPGSDGTNWVLVAAVGTRRPNEPRSHDKNFMLQGDQLHPHRSGNFLLWQTYMNAKIMHAVSRSGGNFSSIAPGLMAAAFAALRNHIYH